MYNVNNNEVDRMKNALNDQICLIIATTAHCAYLFSVGISVKEKSMGSPVKVSLAHPTMVVSNLAIHGALE